MPARLEQNQVVFAGEVVLCVELRLMALASRAAA